jgi:hypothetical protein
MLSLLQEISPLRDLFDFVCILTGDQTGKWTFSQSGQKKSVLAWYPGEGKPGHACFIHAPVSLRAYATDDIEYVKSTDGILRAVLHWNPKLQLKDVLVQIVHPRLTGGISFAITLLGIHARNDNDTVPSLEDLCRDSPMRPFFVMLVQVCISKNDRYADPTLWRGATTGERRSLYDGQNAIRNILAYMRK